MIEYIVNNPIIVLNILTAIVTLAAAIAAVTPSKTDDTVLNALLDVINVFALNVGKAKNADVLTSKAQESKNFRDKTRKTLNAEALRQSVQKRRNRDRNNENKTLNL